MQLSPLLGLLLPSPAAGADPFELAYRPDDLVVDGALTDWGAKASVGGDAQGEPVRLSLAWDRQALYAAVAVDDPDVATAGSGDDPFAVDRIEIRIDVDGSGGALGPGDLRVLAGCDGSTAVYRGSEPSADGRTVMSDVGPVAGLQAAASSRSGGYDVELALPSSLLLHVEFESGTGMAMDILRVEATTDEATQLGPRAASWSWSSVSGESWPQVVFGGGPSLLQRAGGGAGSWLLALLASLLTAGGTAAFFLLRQRRQQARFQVLIRRLEQIERGAGTPLLGASEAEREDTASELRAPSAEATLVEPAPGAQGDEPRPSDLTPSDAVALPRSQSALAAKWTVQPFDQTARDLAARLTELEKQEDEGDATGATEWLTLAEMSLAHVQLHLSENVSVADLAQAMHVSSRTLQRGLKRALGCTPREFLLTIRMREAKRLLKTGMHRVSDVGYQVGFEDPAHFSRRFKRYYGCSPSELVRRYRNAASKEH